MKITQLIEKLEQLKNEHGDLPVYVVEEHEYWGDLYNKLDDYGVRVQDAVPINGPKRSEVEKALIINY